MSRVGLPKGLYYYELGEAWESYLKALGHTVVNSGDTDEAVLEIGCAACSSEACLPIKAYHGHVMQLVKKNIDVLMLPRVVKPYGKLYACPKIIGVNDMIRCILPENIKLITPQMKGDLFSFCVYTGLKLGNSFAQIGEAYKKIRPDVKKQTAKESDINSDGELNILLLGHPYLVCDKGLNMDTEAMLKSLGCRVFTENELDINAISEISADIPKQPFWFTCERSVKAASYAKTIGVDGIVYLSSFGCGPDAFTLPFLRKCARNDGVFFLELYFDEHSGAEGLTTRLEAFCDMIRRKKEVSV